MFFVRLELNICMLFRSYFYFNDSRIMLIKHDELDCDLLGRGPDQSCGFLLISKE